MARGFGGYPVTGVNLSVDRGSVVEDSFGIATQPTVYGGKYSVSGSFDAVYRTAQHATLTAAIKSGIMTGVVTPLGNIAVSDDVHGYTITALALTSLEFKASVGDFLRVTGSFIGQKATSGGTVSDASYSEAPSVFYHIVVNVGTDVKCTSCSFKIDRPVDTDNYILGTEFIQFATGGTYLQNGPSTVTGSVTMANSEYQQFLDLINAGTDTDSPSTSNTNALGGGTFSLTSPNATITLGNAKFTSGSIGAQGRNRFEKTVNFTCAITSESDITFS